MSVAEKDVFNAPAVVQMAAYNKQMAVAGTAKPRNKGTKPGPKPKPSHWARKIDSKGRAFFFNETTKEYCRTHVFDEAAWNKKNAEKKVGDSVTSFSMFLKHDKTTNGVKAKAAAWREMDEDARQPFVDRARAENVARTEAKASITNAA
jgi:hypothetical protein